jgi:acyl-CoA dehydrogenase
LLGGKGLTRGCLIEKLFRDTRAALIEDGSNDILALVGARKILGDPPPVA